MKLKPLGDRLIVRRRSRRRRRPQAASSSPTQRRRSRRRARSLAVGDGEMNEDGSAPPARRERGRRGPLLASTAAPRSPSTATTLLVLRESDVLAKVELSQGLRN